MHLRTQAHPSPYAHAEAKTVQNCSHPDSRKSTGSFRSPSQSELGWDISLGTQLPNRIPITVAYRVFVVSSSSESSPRSSHLAPAQINATGVSSDMLKMFAPLKSQPHCQ